MHLLTKSRQAPNPPTSSRLFLSPRMKGICELRETSNIHRSSHPFLLRLTASTSLPLLHARLLITLARIPGLGSRPSARHYLGLSRLSLRLNIRASPHDSPFNGRPRIRHCLAASSRHHPTRPLPLTISHAAFGSVPQSISALTDAAYPPVPPSRGVSPAGRRSGLERPVGHLLGTRAQTRLHARRPVSQGPARHSDRPLVTSSAQIVRPHATFLVVGCA